MSIFVAAAAGNMAVIKQHLQSGAQLSDMDNTGATVMMILVKNGHWGCVREFLQQEQPDYSLTAGCTALQYAVQNADCPPDVIAKLITSSAGCTAAHTACLTALEMAIGKCSDAQAVALVRHMPADLCNQRLSNGSRPLDAAMVRSHAVSHQMQRLALVLARVVRVQLCGNVKTTKHVALLFASAATWSAMA
jgi:ankyrin repeat protein